MEVTTDELLKDLDYALFVLSLGQSVTIFKNGKAVGVLNPIPKKILKNQCVSIPFLEWGRVKTSMLKKR